MELDSALCVHCIRERYPEQMINLVFRMFPSCSAKVIRFCVKTKSFSFTLIDIHQSKTTDRPLYTTKTMLVTFFCFAASSSMR